MNWDYDLTYEDVELTEDIQALLQYPYGITFSCFFSVTQVFFTDSDPYSDGQYEDIEELNASVIFVNDLMTNILYNLGYMY